ncbi:MAG: hypothetical protein JO032_18985 [Alphaproteobacteria bacterium]|nr:hypothetical protein [Alphaproteobacteria bacterium]
MFKAVAIAAVALSAAAAVTAPAKADRICGPNFYYRYGECRPYAYYYPPGAAVGGAVAGAGYVAGSAVNAAGNVAGAAVNTAGAIAGGVVGAVTGR